MPVGELVKRRRSSLVVGFSRLVTGTLVGQALLLIFAPILTRLYAPSEYGINALFTASVTILSTVALLRLDVPLALTESRRVRRNLSIIVGVSALAFGFLLTVALLALRQPIAQGLSTDSSAWLLVIPSGVVLFAMNKMALQHCLSLQRYGFVSVAGAVRVLVQCISQGVLGVIGWSSMGLIVGLLISYIVSTVMITLYLGRIQERLAWNFSSSQLRRTWTSVSVYPRVALPAELLSIGSFTLIPLAVSVVYGPGAAGLYALANTFLGIPLNLIGNNLRQVYLREGSLELAAKKSLRRSFDASAKMLFAASLPVTLGVWFFAPPFFELAFGSEWRYSGTYAQLLTGFFVARLIVTPLAATVNIVDRQSVGLLANSIVLLMIIAIFVIAGISGVSVEAALMALSIGYLLAYGIFFIVLRSISRRPKL